MRNRTTRGILARTPGETDAMSHSAITKGAVAVITGGASGIGLAAAKRFAQMGLSVCIADLGAERIASAVDALRAVSTTGEQAVLGIEADVSDLDHVRRLHAAVVDRFGGADILMNNAGVQADTNVLGPYERWQHVLGVNLWGAIHGVQVFLPGMIERGKQRLVINTGSKQGITTPPGNPAYNVSKAGLKAFTEAIQHELRNTPGCGISAHLLIPGFVFTGLTQRGRTEKPAGAWTPEQTVEFMFERLDAGDFYILCPDNDVPRSLDERRMLWAAGDIVENRPALSRWHPDYATEFEEFIRKP
jgi:NAD(P)-dependent dehydrogenase (short-subunit alcohol dehydrogenase family)